MKRTAADEGFRAKYLKNHDIAGFCADYQPHECEEFKLQVRKQIEDAAKAGVLGGGAGSQDTDATNEGAKVEEL